MVSSFAVLKFVFFRLQIRSGDDPSQRRPRATSRPPVSLVFRSHIRLVFFAGSERRSVAVTTKGHQQTWGQVRSLFLFHRQVWNDHVEVTWPRYVHQSDLCRPTFSHWIWSYERSNQKNRFFDLFLWQKASGRKSQFLFDIMVNEIDSSSSWIGSYERSY